MIFITWDHQDQQLHGWHTMVWSTRSSMESLIGCIKVIMALLLDLCNWLKCDLFNLRVLLNDRIVCKISKRKMNWARMALYPSQCSSLNAMYKFKPVIINSCYYITRQLSSNLSRLTLFNLVFYTQSVTSLDMIKFCFCFRKHCTKKDQVLLFWQQLLLQCWETWFQVMLLWATSHGTCLVTAY